jgi:hypothetical protein
MSNQKQQTVKRGTALKQNGTTPHHSIAVVISSVGNKTAASTHAVDLSVDLS